MNTDAHRLSATARVAFAVAIIILAGILWWWHASSKLSFDADSYQAVFLTNNQVYFGKVTHADAAYAILSDVYYIQAFSLQALASSTQGNQLQLVKLGSELHQPEGTMYINRNEILFIEPLKTDSKISQAIQNFKTR